MRRPGLVLALAVALFAAALVPASRLRVLSDLSALLSPRDPAVLEATRVIDETGVASRVYVVLESDAPRGARACGDLVAPKIRALGAPVTSAESGIHAARTFLLPRALFFLSLPELERMRATLAAQRERAIVREVMGGDLDDEAEPPPDFSSVRQNMRRTRSRFPDGYFEASDGKSLVVAVTTSVSPSSLVESERIIGAIRAAVTQAMASESCARVRVGYAGDLVTAYESYRVVHTDLLEVGTAGIALVLLVIILFFFRVRALVALALALALALTLTFAIADIVVGHLNVATGFLASIIAGNGINAGIILVARTFEEARRGRQITEAVEIATQGTWRATLGAAVASAVAYGSLAVTNFRALVEFAFIGAEGMLLCWAATYLVVPPLLIVWDRWHPFARTPSGLRRFGLDVGPALDALVRRAPRLLVAGWAAITVLGVALGARHAAQGLVDRDLRRLRADLTSDPNQARIVALASDVLGGVADSPVVFLVPTEEHVPELLRVLAARRAADPHVPFGEAHALTELVASDQEAKRELIVAIRKDLFLARRHKGITDSEWAEVSPVLPDEDPQTWRTSDLPTDIFPAARAGSRTRIVVVESALVGANEYDLRELARLASALREVRLDDGTVVRGTGRQMVFAEMLRRAFDGLPRALAFSLTGTVLAVLFTVRRPRRAALVVLSLGAGLAAMALGMSAFDIRLNLFSVIAIPVAFGIGADYALNLVQRGDAALRGSGGAILVSSATTALGYSALLVSINPAIRSFGGLSVLGEVACVGAALVGLPALLLVTRR